MASGLRHKPYKSYRQILSLKLVPAKTSGRVAQKKKSQMMEEDTLEVDVQGERELLGMDPQKSPSEEGEISDDEFIELAEEDLDTEQILALAQAEEDRCWVLELQREKEEEEELLRLEAERTEALLKLKALRSRRQSLESSLVSPPQQSRPRKGGLVKKSGAALYQEKPHQAISDKSTACRWNPSTETKHGESLEFNPFAFELLDLVKQLKDGKSAPFSLLMAKAMAGQTPGVAEQVVKKADSLPNVFLEGQGVGLSLPGSSRVLGEIQLPQVKPDLASGVPSSVAMAQGEDHQGEPVEEGKSHKLKSGKTTKPDESGIKRVVQYGHEKLNSVHMRSRIFSDLTFHFLVAGEIELILQETMGPQEKLARLHLLHMLCYHREYVDVEDLKDQYNVVMKCIETGQFSWADFKALDAQMHSDLTF